MSSLQRSFNRFLFGLLFLFQCSFLIAQYPATCSGISARSNGNGQSNQCPSGATVAPNFVGTPYATVPAGAKTADITFRFANATSTTLLPYAITRIYVTTAGVTTVFSGTAGPAGIPTQSGTDVLVKYCYYGATNLPTAGLISFELRNPQTGVVARNCSYDATCTSNCATVANPVLLPLTIKSFELQVGSSTASLQWTTDYDPAVTGFEVEKSTKGQEFARIAYVAFSGSSTSRQVYKYEDIQFSPLVETNYRLKILNADGNFYYSTVKKIAVRVNGEVPLVSNTGSRILIKNLGSLKLSGIRVYSLQGALVFKAETRQGVYQINHLKPGMYNVFIEQNNVKVLSRMVQVLK